MCVLLRWCPRPWVAGDVKPPPMRQIPFAVDGGLNLSMARRSMAGGRSSRLDAQVLGVDAVEQQHQRGPAPVLAAGRDVRELLQADQR